MENLSYSNGDWYNGCGCGGRPRQKVEAPPNSKAVLIRRVGVLEGPVTKIKYDFRPHQVSIDIDAADADEWIRQGIAVVAPPNYKGRLTRVSTQTTNT